MKSFVLFNMFEKDCHFSYTCGWAHLVCFGFEQFVELGIGLVSGFWKETEGEKGQKQSHCAMNHVDPRHAHSALNHGKQFVGKKGTNVMQ